MDCVFRCCAPTIAMNRVKAKNKLRDTLGHAHTPEKLLTTIMHGITSWEHQGLGGYPTPLIRGSVRPDDIRLVRFPGADSYWVGPVSTWMD